MKCVKTSWTYNLRHLSSNLFKATNIPFSWSTRYTPKGDGVEGPGPGEVQSVQMDKMTVCAVNHLDNKIDFVLIK